MELGRRVLCCCNAFTWEPCLSIINNSAWNLEHAAVCARVSCQKRSFSPCGDNEATEAWQQAGKYVLACTCTCTPPCVCAGLERQMPHQTEFVSKSLIKLLDWEQRLSSISSFLSSLRRNLILSDQLKEWKKTKSIAQIRVRTSSTNHTRKFWRFPKRNNPYAT